MLDHVDIKKLLGNIIYDFIDVSYYEFHFFKDDFYPPLLRHDLSMLEFFYSALLDLRV